MYSTVEENKDEFILTIQRKNAEYYERISHGNIKKQVAIVLPKNYNFITPLPQHYKKRLLQLGWTINKTIFLEIPYIVSFNEKLSPSLIQTWLCCIPHEKSIIRSVVFTKNYLENAHPIELEDTIVHEQIHLKEDEPDLLAGLSHHIDYAQNETRVNAMVETALMKKYDPELIKQVKKQSDVFACQMQNKLKTIMSGYLEYWIQLYFIDRFSSYRDNAIKMNDDLGQGYLEDLQKTSKEVSNMYEQFNFDIKSLA